MQEKDKKAMREALGLNDEYKDLLKKELEKVEEKIEKLETMKDLLEDKLGTVGSVISKAKKVAVQLELFPKVNRSQSEIDEELSDSDLL